MVSELLAEKPDHIHWLCDNLGLGNPAGVPAPVSGGFHHRMWRLDTDRSSYAVKQLGEDTALTYVDVAGHYNATEAAAEAFANIGVPALHAMGSEGSYLHLIDGDAYLVYPWTESRALARNHISTDQACQVAAIMATMHGADIDVPSLGHERPNFLTGDRLVELVLQARSANVRDALELEAHLDELQQMVEAHPAAIEIMAQNRVVSHGDLDHKNVLWSERGEPLIIDWESTRRLNPTHELLLEALDWSGITAHFELGPFQRFLDAYRQAGGEIPEQELQAALQCVLADWVNWLMYNVGRALEPGDSARHRMSSDQVDLALSTILRIEKLMPRILSCLM